VHIKLAWVYQQQGKWDAAVDEQVRLAQLARQPKFGEQLRTIYKDAGYPGVLDGVMRASKSWGLLELGEYQKARMYILKGDRDSAFLMLEQCVAGRSPWLAFLNVEPAFDSLRSDPRFQALQKSLQGS
jgi:hypothetical protein